MSQYTFGAGALYAESQTDANGSVIATPTPIQFGVLQDVSFDVNLEVKQLHGSSQFPVDVAGGKGSITGKASAAKINLQLFNSIFFGQSITSGSIIAHTDTVGSSIPSSSPYTITPTPPSSGTWTRDLGIISASGVPLIRVESAPSTGEYIVDDGEYTFASADAGVKVFINFEYTVTTGKKMTVVNKPMGSLPVFRLEFSNNFRGKQMTLILPRVTTTKLALATKLDDYMIPSFDFSAFADDNGEVIKFSTKE